MNHFFSAFTGVCLLLAACSHRNDNAADEALPTGGSGAGNATLGSGGGSGSGGTSGAAGMGATAGTSTGGAGAIGGSSALGGRVGAGGEGGLGGSGGTGSPGGGTSATGIDFSIWSLQLPIGPGTSPTTISPGKLKTGFTDEYFYLAADGGQAFMDPQTGTTTSGSQHCRSEMREDQSDGSQAAWASSGTNTLTVSGAVMKVGGGSSGATTVAQIFNGSDSIPLCELQYSNGAHGFEMFYEEAKGQGGSPTDLETPVALNEKYTFTLSLTKGVLTATINGQQVYTHTPTSATLAKRFYFKFGNYDQTTSSGGASTTPYTIVEVYSVDVVHE
jgi:Alginate lyase